jgi:hypothetical protein
VVQSAKDDTFAKCPGAKHRRVDVEKIEYGLCH